MPATCGACKKIAFGLDDLVTCKQCKEIFHIACVNVSREDVRTRNARDSWICPGCAISLTPRGDRSLTPVRYNQLGGRSDLISTTGAADDETTTPHHLAAQVSVPAAAPYPAAPVISPKEVMDPTSDLATEIRLFRKEFAELKMVPGELRNIRLDLQKMQKETREFITSAAASIEMCHGRIDDIGKRISVVEERMAALERRDTESASLHHTVAELREEISTRDRLALLNDIKSQTIDLNGYSLHQHLRTAPVDMYVTRMRVRLPQNSNWVRVERCYFDPRNVSLDTMLLFHDLTISGNVDLYDHNQLDREPSRRRSRDFDGRRGLDGCNMILRLRKAGIGFHTRPLAQQPGKFNVKTDSEFVEPGFISVYAYGCERYIKRNSVRTNDNPLRRKRRADVFSFDMHLDQPEDLTARSTDWDTYETNVGRSNYERSKLFRPDDQLDEAEDISREMEDIFTKGIRTLLTTYMKKELQPAIKETLMRNMGYVISYG